MNFDTAFTAIEKSEYGDHLVKGRASVLLEAALAQSDDFNLSVNSSTGPQKILAIEEPFRIQLPFLKYAYAAGIQDAIFEYVDRIQIKEWKTIRAPYGRDKDGQRERWKNSWHRDPQFLIYAWAQERLQEISKPIYFHFQRIEKSNPPYLWEFHAEVEEGDLIAATHLLMNACITITESRKNFPGGPWLRNYGYYGHCFAFNKKCPFFEYCSGKTNDPSTGIPGPRRQYINEFSQCRGETVIEASGIKSLANCPEKFRLQWEEGYGEPASESLITGTLFHEGIAEAYRVLAKELAQ